MQSTLSNGEVSNVCTECVSSIKAVPFLKARYATYSMPPQKAANSIKYIKSRHRLLVLMTCAQVRPVNWLPGLTMSSVKSSINKLVKPALRLELNLASSDRSSPYLTHSHLTAETQPCSRQRLVNTKTRLIYLPNLPNSPRHAAWEAA